MRPHLEAIAARQGGVFLRRQALAAGYSAKEFERLAMRVWSRVRRGAYVAAEVWRDADALGRHRLLVHAVVAATTVPTVVSGVSAAVMHRLELWKPDLARVQVTHPAESARVEPDVHHHCAELWEDDVVLVDGVAVTSLERTAVDVARATTFEQGVVTMDSVLRRLEVPRLEIHPLLERFGQWPWSGGLSGVVNFGDGRAANVAESRLRVELHALALPPMTPQVFVYDEAGVLVAIVDLLAIGLGGGRGVRRRREVQPRRWRSVATTA